MSVGERSVNQLWLSLHLLDCECECGECVWVCVYEVEENKELTHTPGAGEEAGRLATAAAALSAGFGSCNHLTCVAGPYLGEEGERRWMDRESVSSLTLFSLTPCRSWRQF